MLLKKCDVNRNENLNINLRLSSKIKSLWKTTNLRFWASFISLFVIVFCHHRLLLLSFPIPNSQFAIPNSHSLQYHTNPFFFITFHGIAFIIGLFKMHSFRDKVTQKFSYLFPNSSSSQVFFFPWSAFAYLLSCMSFSIKWKSELGVVDTLILSLNTCFDRLCPRSSIWSLCVCINLNPG